MLNSDAKCATRQSVLQKAAGYGEAILRTMSNAKTIYDAGRAVYGAASAAAPYVQAGLSLL